MTRVSPPVVLAIVLGVSGALAGCGPPRPGPPAGRGKQAPSAPRAPSAAPPAAPTPSSASGSADHAAASTASTNAQVAGTMFGIPVPIGNYYFAKRVSYMFPRPWEESLAGEAREQAIWDQLLMHYESFRRGITVSDTEMEDGINRVLREQKQTFTRAGDPEAYTRWVKETLGEEVGQFENQMRYLFQINTLRDTVRQSLPVTVTEQEMQQEFLNESHHVGGEFAVFDKKEDAEAFYERVKAPGQWDAEKIKDPSRLKPLALMTLEAYIDLWGVPKEQIYAFHDLEPGSVGPPMPFGKQWAVCRLLEKRTGDLADFPKARDGYYEQIKQRKQGQAFNTWFEELKAAAHIHPSVLSTAPQAPSNDEITNHQVPSSK